MFNPTEADTSDPKKRKARFKMTGGKGILILAICPDVPESYFNVKTIFDHMKKSKGTILTSDPNLKSNSSLGLVDHNFLCNHKFEALTL